jgi:ribonuclease P protein component
MDKYAKENISTEQPPAREKARLSRPHGDQERPRGAKTPPRQGPQEADAVALLGSGFGLPKEARLRSPAEFRRAYETGVRIEGRFMTAFVAKSPENRHRLGVTASKKAIGNAVQRNRAKRLLREAFRLSKPEMAALSGKYDWVLNARRRLLETNLDKPLAELKAIVAEFAQKESQANTGETNG